jgi:hypothetical protein
MVYEERNTWSSLIASAIAMAVYIVVTLQQAGGGPLAEVDWVPIMLWTIGGSIVGAIVLSILWGIIAGMGDPEGVGKSDQRDRDIARFGSRVGQGFIIAAGLGAIALCAVEADWFWIGNALYLIGAVGAGIGAIASIRAYRGYFHG